MATSTKLDLYKLHANEYAAPRTPTTINIGPARYLTITGKGQPGGEAFTARLGALYNVAFTVKMAKKFAGRDYAVCKLEGLWWGPRKQADFFQLPPAQWNWKLIIRTPDFITEQDLQEAIDSLLERAKPRDVADVKLEPLDEGLSVQMLHTGPYSRESETISKMKSYAASEGLIVSGLHHEIYLSDPRRVAPERLRTILRYPVAKKKR